MALTFRTIDGAELPGLDIDAEREFDAIRADGWIFRVLGQDGYWAVALKREAVPLEPRGHIEKDGARYLYFWPSIEKPAIVQGSRDNLADAIEALATDN